MQDEMNDLQYTTAEDPDIVKVVRCGECRHNPEEGGVGWIFCPLAEEDTRKPDDFCSYGVRK